MWFVSAGPLLMLTLIFEKGKMIVSFFHHPSQNGLLYSSEPFPKNQKVDFLFGSNCSDAKRLICQVTGFTRQGEEHAPENTQFHPGGRPKTEIFIFFP